MKKQTQPIKSAYPTHITAGTNIFFVTCDIFEHQHKAGVKTIILQTFDTKRRLANGHPESTSETKRILFLKAV